jgi:hypothetical protein
MSRHHEPHDPRLLRLLDALPHPARRSYTWLIRPEGRWLRLPLGVAVIVGGILGFLPVLGFWMVPLGALLLGEDVPPVRRLTLRALGKAQQWWDASRNRKRSQRDCN